MFYKQMFPSVLSIKSLRLIIVLLVFLQSFSSCSVQRRQIAAPLRDEGPEFLVEKLKTSKFDFDNFSAKFALDFQKNRSANSFTGQIRMAHDSIIWASLMISGSIEAARVMITNDSVKFVEKLISNNYFYGDYNYINEFLQTNVDFSILQSLLLGNDFEYYEHNEFKASIDDQQYKLSSPGRRKLNKYIKNSSDEKRVFIQDIWLDPVTYKINKVKIREVEQKGRTLQTEYSDFIDISGQLFPTKIKFLLQDKNKFKAEIRFSKIDTKTQLNFPFSVPKNK